MVQENVDNAIQLLEPVSEFVFDILDMIYSFRTESPTVSLYWMLVT